MGQGKDSAGQNGRADGQLSADRHGKDITDGLDGILEPRILLSTPDDPPLRGRSEYPKSDLKLENRHIDNVRSLRVTVIGAGLAGVLAGILLPEKVPEIQLTILEKNSDVVRIPMFAWPQPIDLHDIVEWHMAGERLSWRTMRHPVARVPGHLLPKHAVVAAIC